jgi:adenosylcobinamide-GDP ribazoletransferase
MVGHMSVLRRPFDDFLTATALLTRLPVGGITLTDGAIAAAAWAFPLVGAGVGALAALVFFAAEVAGSSRGIAALLSLTAGLALTGALHEDGLADTVDGFSGGQTREQKLAIMRDSRVGTFGVIALVLSLGLRASVLATIGDPIRVALSLIAAHSAARGALPVLMHLLPQARTDGLGVAAGRPSLVVAIGGAVIGAGIALAVLGPVAGAVALAADGAVLALAGLLARQQIGGYTGDVLGFFEQIGETVILLAAAAR